MASFYIFIIFSLLILSLVASASSGITCNTLKDIFGVTRKFNTEDINVDKLNIYSFIRDNKEKYNVLTAARDLLTSNKLDMDQNLYVWIHGWNSNVDKSHGVVNALLEKGYKNVYALDSSAYIDTIKYIESSSYTKHIGNKLAEVLVDLKKAGLNNNRIHLIGHSLGAQIAGFAGKAFFEATGNKIERISGLDPAGPCFESLPESCRLIPSDASFVDVIHSSAGILGIDLISGDVDFFVNGGSYQSGCNLIPTCNHGRAVDYYAESILYPDAFPAVKAESWKDFLSYEANREIRYMGFAAKPGGSGGTYYLRTNSKSLYGVGMFGIQKA